MGSLSEPEGSGGCLTSIRIEVLGKPEPGGSKSAFAYKSKTGGYRTRVVDANKNVAGWKESVKAAAKEVYSGDPSEDAMLVIVRFYLQRPKYHFDSKGELKKSAPKYPTNRPDTVKLMRGTEDALTGIIWKDDAQNVDIVLRERYGEAPKCEIVIWSMSSVPSEIATALELLHESTP